MIIISMSHLKRLILLAFIYQLLACGQKGPLVLDDKEIVIETKPPLEQQAVDPEKKANKP